MAKREIKIDYTNYKGERAVRAIIPIEIRFGFNDYHKGEQWFLLALAVDRNNEKREFALTNIHAFVT